MKTRFPLYSKILLWLLANLLLLATVAGVLLAGHFGLDLLVSGRAGDRVRSVRDAIRAELSSRPLPEWNAVLKRYSESYGVEMLLFEEDGTQLAGSSTVLPDEVLSKLRGEPRPGPGPRPPGATPGSIPAPGAWESPEFEEWEHRQLARALNGGPEAGEAERKPSRRGPGFRHGPGLESGAMTQPRLVLRTSNPTRYWVGLYSLLPSPKPEGRRRSILLMASENLHGGGLFLDTTPLIWIGSGTLLLSVLFWLPLVRRITHSLGQLTAATERIAQGRFDGRVTIRRNDELGQLGVAVNEMAQRLEGFVNGQKRFLGDIAHELCSPIARIQMALAILEQRADVISRPYVEDLHEEIQQMSDLVAELLSFSKASLAGHAVKRTPVRLRELVEQTIRRENLPEAELRVVVEGEPEAWANPELLQRALANLIRNAVRYAGQAGPITISARCDADKVWLSVSDCGPGVPEEALKRLFDPFFRVDDARTREAGGVGLGLTIVKTCIEACGGTVACHNLVPSGLEVVILLALAGASEPEK